MKATLLIVILLYTAHGLLLATKGAKIKAFLLGLKFGVLIAGTLPYAFLAGIIQGTRHYSDAIEKRIAGADK